MYPADNTGFNARVGPWARFSPHAQAGVGADEAQLKPSPAERAARTARAPTDLKLGSALSTSYSV